MSKTPSDASQLQRNNSMNVLQQNQLFESAVEKQRLLQNASLDPVDEKLSSAFDRKVISKNYHSRAYPAFMKANGPFKVYDYAEVKGGNEYSRSVKNVSDQALKRFRKEMERVVQLKNQ